MSENNNNLIRGGARKKKPATARVNSQVKNNNNSNVKLAKRDKVVATQLAQQVRKLDNMKKQGQTLSVRNGMVEVSMSKNKVDTFIDCILNPEKADRVLPMRCTDKGICQYVGASIDMQLDNGLVGSTSFKSFVACTGNPECPLASSKQGNHSWTVKAGNFWQLESFSQETGSRASAFAGNLWLSNGGTFVTMMLPSEIKATAAFTYDNTTIPKEAIRIYECNFAGVSLTMISQDNGNAGVMLFYSNAGALLGQVNFDPTQTSNITPAAGTAGFGLILNNGQNVDLKFSHAAETTLTVPGLYNLKALTSSTYAAVAATNEDHRVVSSSVCLTYAPDLQFGGGNLLSALCEQNGLSEDFISWENYLYTRRRTYLNRALTGGYNLYIANPASLNWKNTNRYNLFAPDGGCMALSMITYNPSNAAVLTELNMQVKGHQWYEFATADPSRSPKRYMSQDPLCERILSGLSALYRPSENAKHHDWHRVVANAWHWFNGGSDEATALRKAITTTGKGAIKALPGLLAML